MTHTSMTTGTTRDTHTLLLAAMTALLLLSTPCVVGASPCKQDGEVCRTSRSCCGTSGRNGVCVKESGERFGLCCTQTGNDTNCDGLDNDCDGVADDGYQPTATTCGSGACASTGSLECVNGTTQDTCTPGTPDCAGSECGDDGCGGSCGTCTPPAVCSDAGPPHLCEIPICSAVVFRCTCTNENHTCHTGCPPDVVVGSTCAEARDGCAAVCANQGSGPGDCLTQTCTDCATGEQCPE